MLKWYCVFFICFNCLLFDLFQNYPNPFNPTTTISFSIPEPNNTRLIIYDYLGREIKTIFNEFRSEGTYNISFEAHTLASGVYFYKLSEYKNYYITKTSLLKIKVNDPNTPYVNNMITNKRILMGTSTSF